MQSTVRPARTACLIKQQPASGIVSALSARSAGLLAAGWNSPRGPGPCRPLARPGHR